MSANDWCPWLLQLIQLEAQVINGVPQEDDMEEALGLTKKIRLPDLTQPSASFDVTLEELNELNEVSHHEAASSQACLPG